VTDLGSQKQGKLRPRTCPHPMTSTVTSAACLLAGLFQEHEQRECRQDLRLTINCQQTNPKYFPSAGHSSAHASREVQLKTKDLLASFRKNSSAAPR